MATDSRSAAARPLFFAAAWFVILAAASFGWAAVESQSASRAEAAQPNAVVVAR